MEGDRDFSDFSFLDFSLSESGGLSGVFRGVFGLGDIFEK